MTEAEALEVAAAYLGNCLQAVTLYISLTFGFLTVCHVAGDRLSRVEAVGISCLYTFGSVTTTISFLNANRFYGLVLENASSYVASNPFSHPGFWEIAGGVFCLAGTVASLCFMVSVQWSEMR